MHSELKALANSEHRYASVLLTATGQRHAPSETADGDWYDSTWPVNKSFNALFRGMRCLWDLGCAYVRLVNGLLIVEFTKQSDHEVTIQDLERKGDVLVRMPRQRLSIVWCILRVSLNLFPVLLDVRKHDDPAMVLR
jgi:hypothetical protein